jgi:UDP-N-acetylglucosamine:LPS N-acetylglucosamine transferase
MKKITILTSEGGGGHTTATKALINLLHDEYEISVIHVFKEILFSLDFFKKITCNRYSGEELYNYLLQKNYYRLISVLFYYCGIWFIQLKKKHIQNLLRTYFTQNTPDLIISVIPSINDSVLAVAQELSIPFILMPTDLDISIYLRGITNPTYTSFYLCLPFNNQQIAQPAIKSLIQKNQIRTIGPLTHDSFFVTKNIIELKKEHNLGDNKPIVMVLMGARGSSGIKNYIARLAQIQKAIHIVACIGSNTQSRQALEKLFIPEHITLTIIDFTDRIADYMTLADIIITKSGSISVCEGIIMNTPLLLDATSTVLPWERFNHHFIATHQFGDIITKHRHIVPLVSSLLNNQELLQRYKSNLVNFNQRNEREQLKKLIAEIIK